MKNLQDLEELLHAEYNNLKVEHTKANHGHLEINLLEFHRGMIAMLEAFQGKEKWVILDGKPVRIDTLCQQY